MLDIKLWLCWLEFIAYWKCILKVELTYIYFFLQIINIIAYCLVFHWGMNPSRSFICKWKQHAHLSSRTGINSLQS